MYIPDNNHYIVLMVHSPSLPRMICCQDGTKCEIALDDVTILVLSTIGNITVEKYLRLFTLIGYPMNLLELVSVGGQVHNVVYREILHFSSGASSSGNNKTLGPVNIPERGTWVEQERIFKTIKLIQQQKSYSTIAAIPTPNQIQTTSPIFFSEISMNGRNNYVTQNPKTSFALKTDFLMTYCVHKINNCCDH